MVQLHTLLVYTHIAIGAIALVLFWAPVLARKGSATHVRPGRVYVVCMYAVVISAFAASLMVLADPLAIRAPGLSFDAQEAAARAERYRMFSLFLLMLSVLVFASLRHGIAALRARRNPEVIRSPVHRTSLVALGIVAVAVLFLGVRAGHILLMIFGGIGTAAAIGMFRDTLRRNPTPRDYVMMHLDGLIGTGIGAYTAFFAFGGSRLFADILVGQWQVVAWVLPAIIGSIAIQRLKRSPAKRTLERAAPAPSDLLVDSGKR